MLATAACAEHVAGAVVAAFTRRVPGAAVDLTCGSTDCAAAALAEDVADIALGVRPAPLPGQPLESVPFLRYSRVVVAAPGHPLGRRAAAARRDLAGAAWLTGPAGIEAGSEEERWADRGRPAPEVVPWRARPLRWTRCAAGTASFSRWGTPSRADLRRGALVRLPVVGTPVTGLWWASVPGEGARRPGRGRCSAS